MMGTHLNDRYQIESELGQGGMGTVYRAFDALLQREVAIKVLAAQGLGTEGRARLLREARAAAGLNHPNIVTIYDVEEADGHPFIVMEYVEGNTLADWNPGDLPEMLALTRQVCQALSHAHEKEVVHRDLKPENVMVTSDGNVLLMDFGIARSTSSRVTTEGNIIGTVHYMAPEQALGQDLDGRADLYALGAMLYELLTGELPFTADDPFAIITQHLHAPLVPPRARKDAIPPALDALIVRLLAKKPADRPASAREVIGILDEIAHPPVVETPRVASPITQPELSLLERIVRGRMVGRERKLAVARTLWVKALGRQGGTLLISGDPGIGKTRFVRELVTQVGVTGGIALVGACYAEGGAPYSAFAHILRESLTDDRINELDLPDFVLADLIRIAPDLRLHFPDIPPNPPLDRQADQERLYQNVVYFCKKLSDSKPLLLVVEDAHWADSGTLTLLQHLARRASKQRALIVATYREIELDQTLPFQDLLRVLNRERLATRVRLSPLSKSETEAMLASLFAEEITPDFLEGIYFETEGNPFFIEEVCKALVESGDLYFENGRWHRLDIGELEIPQSVRVAIQERVGRLANDIQDLLRLAAIIGREFDFDVLLEASAFEEDVVIDALEQAEEAQIIEEVGGKKGVRFAFVHALIPATLVDGVRTLSRRRLHRAAAVVLEKVYPDDYPALAYHFEEAGDEEKAFGYSKKAGDQAAAAFANREAKVHFQAALDLAGKEEEKAELLEKLGEALVELSQNDEAIQTFKQSIVCYRSLDNLEKTAYLYGRSARAASFGGDFQKGLAICREGIKVVEGSPDSSGFAYLIHETARASYFNGLIDEAQRLGEQALAMADRLGDVLVKTEALTTLGSVTSEVEKAISLHTKAIEEAENAGLYDQAARAHNNLAVVLALDLGDWRTARQHRLHAAGLARRQGSIINELFFSSGAAYIAILGGEVDQAEQEHLAVRELADIVTGSFKFIYRLVGGFILEARGEFQLSVERLREIYAEAREIGDLQTISFYFFPLCDLLLGLGRLEEAENILQELIETRDPAKFDYFIGVGAYLQMAMLRARQGRLEEARSFLNISKSNAQDPRWKAYNKVWLGRAEAHLLVAEKNWEEAWPVFERAAEEFAHQNFRVYHAQLLTEWAGAHLQRGEPDDLERAEELLKEALEAFKSMNLPLRAQRARERLEKIKSQLD